MREQHEERWWDGEPCVGLIIERRAIGFREVIEWGEC